MGSGDTFHMKAGSYNQRIYESTINVPNGIDAAHPTIVEGEGATGCALAENCNTVLTSDGHNIQDGQYITIRNLSIYGNNQGAGSCLRLANSSPVTSGIIIDNVEMHHCWEHGVFTSTDLNGLTMRNFSIHHTNVSGVEIGGHGCYLEGDDTLMENFAIHDITNGTNVLGCQIYDSSNPNTVDRAIIRNGTVYNVTHGDALFVSGANSQVYNMIVRNSLRGITVTTGSTAGGCNTGNKIYNNIVYNNTIGLEIGLGVSACGGVTIDITNNIVIANTQDIDLLNGWRSAGQRNAGTCGSSCGASPIPLSAITDVTISTTDFHLKSGTNAAVDAAATISAITTDKDLKPRPYGVGYDIGPYEWRPTNTSPLAAPVNLQVR